MALRMTKVALFTAAVALVVGGGFTVKEQRERSVLAARLDTQTDEMAAAYRQMAEQHVFPSENSTELTQDQRKAAAHVRTMYSQLTEEMVMTEKVTAINELQMALISYLRHSLFSPSFVDSTATLSLQQALGEQGSVVDMLRGYNDTARQWNGLRASTMSRLQGQILGQEEEMLPYMRFDGNKEFIAIISI